MQQGLADAPPGYPNASSAVWELEKVVPMQYNRLVLYNARLFHSPHVTGEGFGDTKQTRRLTQNLYFQLGAAVVAPVQRDRSDEGI